MLMIHYTGMMNRNLKNYFLFSSFIIIIIFFINRFMGHSDYVTDICIHHEVQADEVSIYTCSFDKSVLQFHIQ